MSQISDSYGVYTKAFEQLFGQSFQGVEKLAALNVQTFQALLADVGTTLQAVLTVKSPDELLKLQQASAQTLSEKAAEYARQTKELLSAAQTEQRDAAQAQFADLHAKVLEAFNSSLQNVPGGDSTRALVQFAVSAANDAFESANKVSKQMANVVDANVLSYSTTVPKRAAKSKAA